MPKTKVLKELRVQELPMGAGSGSGQSSAESDSFLVNAGDHVIVVAGEALKTTTREFFSLSGKLINGTAAAVLHLTFQPGYNSKRRARFTSQVDTESSDDGEAGAVTTSPQGWFHSLIAGTQTSGEGSAAGEGHSRPGKRRTRRDRAKAEEQAQAVRTLYLPFALLAGTVKAIAKRVLAFNSLVIPHYDSGIQVAGKLVKGVVKVLHTSSGAAAAAATPVTSAQAAVQAMHQLVTRARSAGSTGMVEDVQLAVLVAIDNATTYARRVFRVVVTSSWRGQGGAAGGVRTRLRTAEVRSFPLLRHPSAALTPKLSGNTSSHSAGLIKRVCGYPVQSVMVTTADGYVLNMVRIPRPESRRVAFFQHGLLDSASAWVSNGNVFSLACRAYESGSDVFLGNFRGTDDSTTGEDQPGSSRHVKYSRSEAEFWNYSVDDHSLDVMACINSVRVVKRRELERQLRRKRRSAIQSGQEAKLEEVQPLSITGIGHSMGGAALLLYVIHANALRIPHGLDKLVLLSPAGCHKVVPWFPLMLVEALHATLTPVVNGPFPMRSSRIQQAGAKLLQDLKRSPAAVDFMASLASIFFGGATQHFAFQHVQFTDYPLGGSSVKVIRHGVQVARGKCFRPFNYSAKENLARYGSKQPPLYKDSYHLYDLPIHFMAGNKDVLIPPVNIRAITEMINTAAPGVATVTYFDMGHLDFTLGLDDALIAHVLMHLKEPLPAQFAGVDRHSPREDWVPARTAAKEYPMLACFSKLDATLDGLDRMAMEQGSVARDSEL